MVSDIRTICPLLTLALAHPAVPLYVVTEPRDTKNLADADVDVDAILGRISPGSPTQRRHLVAMQSMFFRFARTGELQPDRFVELFIYSKYNTIYITVNIFVQ